MLPLLEVIIGMTLSRVFNAEGTLKEIITKACLFLIFKKTANNGDILMEIKIDVFPFSSDEAFNDAVKENINTMADALLKRMVDADAKIQNDKAGILMLKSKIDAMQQEIVKALRRISELDSEIDTNIADFKVAQEILRQLCPSNLPESWR